VDNTLIIKSKPAVVFLFLTGCLPILPWLGGSRALRGNSTLHEERFAAVQRYWEWSAYWRPDGLDFPQSVYRPNQSFRALVFLSEERYLGFRKPYWGFCSQELGVCQAYSAWPDQTVEDSRGIRIRRGETDEAALNRFRLQGFTSDREMRSLDRVSSPRLLAGTETTSLGASQGKEDSTEDRLITTIQVITLPRLRAPEAIRDRKVNKFVENLIRSQVGGDCTVIVPFADLHSPLVPVLSVCAESRGIQFMRKDGDEWVASVGGWVSSGEVLNHFEPLVKRHASLVVSPKRPNP
jgi:hypothetical protein